MSFGWECTENQNIRGVSGGELMVLLAKDIIVFIHDLVLPLEEGGYVTLTAGDISDQHIKRRSLQPQNSGLGGYHFENN